MNKVSEQKNKTFAHLFEGPNPQKVMKHTSELQVPRVTTTCKTAILLQANPRYALFAHPLAEGFAGKVLPILMICSSEVTGFAHSELII